MLRRPWLIAGGFVALIAIGAFALAHFAPPQVEVGRRAPDFSAVDLHTGKPVSLDHDYLGRVTLINIWETTCVPCQQEIPAMDSLYRDLAPRGFRIAAVSVDPGTGSAETVRQFALKYGISFDVLHDPDGKISDTYQATGVPESFLVDRTGHIMRIAQMAAPWNSAENHRIVEDLLDAPQS
jgi:peroxiredoxin